MPNVIAELGSRGTQFDIALLDFTGGINNSQRDEDVADNELSAGANYLPEHPGSLILRKRDGLTAISSDLAENGQMIFCGKHADYVCTLTKIQQVDGTDVTTSLTSSTTWDAATFNDGDVFVNGTDERVSTNGTSTAALGGSPPNFTFIEAHNQFLFGAGHSLGILRWSGLGVNNTWSSTNTLTLSTDEDDDITGLIKFRDVLFVTTDKRFFHVNGTSVTNMSVTYAGHEGPGCTAHRSLVVNPFGLFMWTNQGLAVSRDGVTFDLPMQRKLKGTLAGLNEAQYANVHGVWNPLHDRVEYSVFDGSSTTCDLKIYYYYLLDAFYLGTGTATQMNASGLVIVSGLPTIYVVGYSANSATDQVFSLLGDTDIAGNISAFMETKRIWPGGSPTVLSRVRDMTLKTGPVPSAGNITIGAYLDDETSIVAANSFTVAALTTVADDILGMGKRCNKIKIRIEDTLATRPRIHGATLRGTILSN